MIGRVWYTANRMLDEPPLMVRTLGVGGFMVNFHGDLRRLPMAKPPGGLMYEAQHVSEEED